MSLMLLAASFLMYRGFHNSLARSDDRLAGGARPRADGPVRSPPGPVRRGEDPALLPAARRARASDPGRPERRAHAGSSARAGRPRRRRLRAGRLRDAARSRGFTSSMDTIDEGFFHDPGVPILSGRGFRASDAAESPRVAVVNEHFAKHYWPNGDAVGKRIRLDRANGRAGRDRRRRADDQVSRHLRPGHRLPLHAARASTPSRGWSCCCGRTAIRCSCCSPSKSVVHGTRREHADARDADLRGPLPLRDRGGPGHGDQARRHAGSGGSPARDRRPVRAGGVQREPADPRDRHPHRDRREARATCSAWSWARASSLVAVGTAIGLALGFALERLMNAMLFNAGGIDLAVYLCSCRRWSLVTDARGLRARRARPPGFRRRSRCAASRAGIPRAAAPTGGPERRREGDGADYFPA